MTASASGDTILIRPYREDDVQPLYDAVIESRSELSRWLPWAHQEYSIHDSDAWVHSRAMAWRNAEEYSFVITDAEDRTFLGGVGLNRLDLANKTGNLGWWVRSSATCRGVATAAARHCVRFGFDTLELNRIEIICAIENAPSVRVADKLNAQREGVLHARLEVLGTAQNAVLFAIIRGSIGGFR